MPDNPYRSPQTVDRGGRRADGRSFAADMALLGLVYGGTIGAATGVTAALGWLGYSFLKLISVPEAVPVNQLTAVETLVGAAVARIFLAGCLGTVTGLMLGLATGWLAATARPGLRCRMVSLTAATSAIAGLGAVLLVWYLSTRLAVSRTPAPPIVMLGWVAAVGAIGGRTLGGTLSARACPPFSPSESEIQ